jgi:hypothetical protein
MLQRMPGRHVRGPGRPRSLSALLAGLALSGSSFTARADEPSHAIGAEIALVASAVRDDLLVPHAQSGGGLSLGLEYLGHLGPGFLDGAARVGLAAGADRLGAVGAALEQGLGLRYVLPVASPGAWRVAAGPAVGADADVFLFGDWDDAHGYWMGSTWLGPAGRAWRPVGARWRLDLAGELALVGLVSRPPAYRENKQDALDSPRFYFVHAYEGAEPSWIGQWQLARLRLELSRARSQSFVTRAWRFGIEARVARAAQPEPAFALALKLVVAKGWGW